MSKDKGPAKLSLFATTAILCTWSTTSSNVMYPFCFATLGLVLGPLLMLLTQAIMCGTAVVVVEAAQASGATTLGELGFALGGERGRLALRAVQLANQILFMPSALVLSAEGVRQIAQVALDCDTEAASLDAGAASACSWWGCHINSLLLMSLLAWPLLLGARDFHGHALVSLATLSCGLIVVQTVSFVVAAFADTPVGVADEDARLFGPVAGTSWLSVVAAIAVFPWSFAPLFIAVEVQASMARPAEMRTALLAAWLLPSLAVYLPTGDALAALWGANVPDPVTDALPADGLSVVSLAVLTYSCLLDFVLAGTVVNGEVQRAFFPDVAHGAPAEGASRAEHARHWLRSLPQWMLITLPSLLPSLIIALLVPDFQTMAGLTGVITIPWISMFAPPLLLLLMRAPAPPSQQHAGQPQTLEQTNLAGRIMGSLVGKPFGALELAAAEEDDGGGGWANGALWAVASGERRVLSWLPTRPLLIASMTLACGLFVVIFAEAVDSITTLTYSGTTYWCDEVGA